VSDKVSSVSMWISGDRTPSPTLVALRAATDRALCRYSFDVALTSDHDVINHINRGLMPHDTLTKSRRQ